MACKALSPAVNDPYTAVQAIDHLSVIFCALAVRPLGDDVAADPTGRGVVIVPGRRFGDYLATMCGLLRRYGCAEPTVALALLGLLHKCATVLADDPVSLGRGRASRPTSFWRTPPERPRNPPTSRPSSPPRPTCSGVWHCTLPSASDSPSDSAMLNRRSSSASLPRESDGWAAAKQSLGRCVPPPGSTELDCSHDRLKEHAENQSIAHHLQRDDDPGRCRDRRDVAEATVANTGR